ncbi:MAG: cytochrome ubiquinol oxidase subunit I [Alistipes sp.]|nr:cytochrome ubiquinol oxidase subunit I [Alistipes sp.]
MFLETTADFMEVVNWSRAQFAMTAIYHFLFVPLTLGLSFLCAFMHTQYYRTGEEFWKRTTKFWMKVFAINFAIGIATGIILEFEFGTNWSNYSFFVGDIFGAPLAIEGILAFFLEATFVAVMFFGWDRVSKGFHLTSTWMTAVGANLSALWILVANAWMQHPVGMTFNVETARNEMYSFWEVLLSPVAINKFCHTVLSGFVLGAVFVIGVSAWFMLKKREERFARQSIKIAAIFGIVSSILLITTGDKSSRLIAEFQPMKLAAAEGLYDGGENADMVIIGVFKPADRIEPGEDPFRFGIRIPGLLSILSFHDRNAYVAGINDLINGDEEHDLMPASEKIERGRVAIAELGRYRQAIKDNDSSTAEEVVQKFSPDTPEGREFLTEYFKYFGYGYLQSPDDLKLNVPLLFYSYRLMVGCGMWFVLLFLLVLYALYRKKGSLPFPKWLQYAMLWSIPLAYLAGQAGWIVAEVGRQPWTIQDLLPTVAAVSRIDAGSVKVTFFLFVILFTTLLIAEVMIMTRQIKIGPKNDE